MVPSDEDGVSRCPHPPLIRVPGRRPHTGILTTARASLTTAGVSRHSNRSAAGPQRAASAKPGVSMRQRQVTTRGCLTSADLPGLFLLAVSGALPARRGCGPVSKGTAWTLGGLSRQDRRPGRAYEVGNHNITHRRVVEAMSQVTL